MDPENKSQMRIRIAHTVTLKEGWRLGETTVEWNGPADDPSWEQSMAQALRRSYKLGKAEAEQRKVDEV